MNLVNQAKVLLLQDCFTALNIDSQWMIAVEQKKDIGKHIKNVFIRFVTF